MVKGRHTSIRLAPATDEKLQALVERYGTVSAAITVAVDRLWLLECAGWQEGREGVRKEGVMTTDQES